MDFLTRFGLEKNRLTYLIMVLILAMGVNAYSKLPKRADPVVTIRTAVVVAKFPGMTPERVEELIAIPIERKIREIGEVEDIETIITSGQALVYAHLYDEVSQTGIEDAWEDIRNNMNAVKGELPEGTEGPIVNTSYGDVAIATIAVTGEGFTMAQIEDVAEELQKDLYREPGVTKVSFFGEQDERIWLDLDTRKLASVGVQLDQILQDLQAQNVVLPAGVLAANGTDISLEANGDLGTVEDIENVLTKVPGLSGYVRLVDLVDVRRGYVDPKESPVFFNGEKSIVLAVEMSETADVQKLGRSLKKRITAFEQRQPWGISFRISTFQETNVNEAIGGALENVAQTFIVVLLVMLVFLGARAAIVIACIVPFTICFALLSMGPLGVDIQQVSIAAVIISLGLLVDNGLVMVEDIEGRIKRGMDPKEASLVAGKQYVVPLGVASITTVSAFLPMLLISGTTGEFAYSLGAVVAAMLLGSWITALYVLPFLCTLLIKPSDKEPKKNRLIAWYGRTTARLLPRGVLTMAVTFALIFLSMTQFAGLKQEMFPATERADFLIYMDMPKGTGIDRTEDYALKVNDWLMDESINPGVKNTTIFVGDGGPRFYLSLNPAKPSPSSAFFMVNTHTNADAVELLERARRVFIEQYPAARFRVSPLSNGGSESGIVDIEISGPDAQTLVTAAETVHAAFGEIPYLVRQEVNWGNKILKIVVDIAQDKAREFGVTSEQVSKVMDSYFSGTAYSIFREEDKQIPIVLRAARGSRDSIEDLANLSIAASGRLISIDQVATFRPKLEYSEIRRKNQVRQIIISGKSSTLSAAEVIAELQPTLDSLNLGADYSISIGGELEDSAESYGKLGANLPLAIGVMILALVFQFNSARRTILTFMTIPIILVGAPFAMIMADKAMSFFAVLGLMSLMGIIINNAIVLINQIDIERETLDLKKAIVKAAEQRATPIILTSLTTVFGLIPMAVDGGALFEPMATIMIGGLIIASPLTLFFVPSVYYLMFRGSAEKA